MLDYNSFLVEMYKRKDFGSPRYLLRLALLAQPFVYVGLDLLAVSLEAIFFSFFP